MRIPTVCPKCGEETLHHVDIAVAAGALLCGTSVLLSSQCHRIGWSASAQEMQQIRQYLAALLPAIRAEPASGRAVRRRPTRQRPRA